MDENTISEKLMMFGLTRQEANIYLCIYQNGDLTGYEVAKLTGISRSNVYSALSGLTDKGAAYLVEGNSSKYTSVPIQEFCDNKIRALNKEKDFLINNIPDRKVTEIGYITIEGFQNIWDKIIRMIQEADKRIYISAASSVINDLENELENVLAGSIKLVIISDALPTSRIIREKSTCYQCSARENNIRLIIDSVYALTGEITGSKGDTCLYTGQKNFISVFKETLRNEIKLIQLQGEEKL